MKISPIPLLILLSLITRVPLLILMGSSAKGLASASHIVPFGMDQECYGKVKILIFAAFFLSSALEGELHSICIIQTLKEHLCSEMSFNICSQIYDLTGRQWGEVGRHTDN